LVGKLFYIYFIMEHILLDEKDYKDILRYYNIDYTTLDDNDIKINVENIIANKLCRCIKRVTKFNRFENEQPAIAICNASILKNRNLKYYGFSCDKTPTLLSIGTKGKNKFDSGIKLTKQRPGKLFLKKQTRRKTPSSKPRKTRRKTDQR